MEAENTKRRHRKLTAEVVNASRSFAEHVMSKGSLSNESGKIEWRELRIGKAKADHWSPAAVTIDSGVFMAWWKVLEEAKIV